MNLEQLRDIAIKVKERKGHQVILCPDGAKALAEVAIAADKFITATLFPDQEGNHYGELFEATKRVSKEFTD